MLTLFAPTEQKFSNASVLRRVSLDYPFQKIDQRLPFMHDIS